MILIRPAAITETVLISTNAVETPPAAFNAGTTYALNDLSSFGLASATDGTWTGYGLRDVYRSLAPGNIGHAPASSPTWWKRIGSVYQEWANATAYAVGDRVQVTSAHKVFQAAAAHSGKNPLTDTTGAWIEVGATNRWAMFDQVVGTQTAVPESLVVSLKPGGRFDSLAMDNVTAASVQVVVTTAAGAIVYDRTVDMISTVGITNLWAWFTEPVDRSTTVLLTDLPAYSGATVTITLNEPAGEAGCGICVLGLSRTIGKTRYGASVGAQDYSRKERDQFGGYSFVERAYSKRANFTVLVENVSLDAIAALLTEYRAKPIFYIGASEYGLTSGYGVLKDWAVEIAYPTHSELTIEAESLI